MVCPQCGTPVNAKLQCSKCSIAWKSRDLSYRGLIFHDLRRTAARNLRRAGIAEGVIMRIGGWRTRSVFERYAIVDQGDIADAMKKLQTSEQKNETGYSIGYSEPKPAAIADLEVVN